MGDVVYFSRFFCPTLKERPAESEIVSHQLMLRSGMIRQTASGIYAWLPMGLRVINKISNIIINEQNKVGATQILMPTIQSADLWIQSGRLSSYGPEMLRIKDRHHRDLLYGPTNEEMITAIFRDNIISYRQCPQLLYQIQWKFRDEIRPRFGVLRGREFLMKDGYSFDVDIEHGLMNYQRMFVSYLCILSRLGLNPIPMRADSGVIGGEHSHEFIILSNVGESRVYLDQEILNYKIPDCINYENSQELSDIVKKWTKPYAATDDIHNESLFMNVTRKLEARGIEVGHTFFFGDKYSRSLGAVVDNIDGKKIYIQMGSYGLGVTRLVAAIIESSHDLKGICWPQSVAPFDISLVNLCLEKIEANKVAQYIIEQFIKSNLDVLYDDRDISFGSKLSDHDLIGCPWQVIIGKNSLKHGFVEIKKRSTHESCEVSKEQVFSYIKENM